MLVSRPHPAPIPKKQLNQQLIDAKASTEYAEGLPLLPGWCCGAEVLHTLVAASSADRATMHTINHGRYSTYTDAHRHV